MFKSEQSFNVLIGKDIASAATQYTNPSGAGYIKDGEILVIGANGALLTAGDTISTSPSIQFVQRSGSNLIFSSIIDGTKVTKYSGANPVPAQQQVISVGYNGTTGSIDLSTASKLFKISYKHNQLVWSEQVFKRVYETSGSTQAKVASDISEQINFMSLPALNGVYSTGDYVSAIMLCNHAGAAITGAATTLTVTKGSNTAVMNNTHNLTSGDYVRIAGTGTTNPVYRVQSVNGNTITLGSPYQSSSNVVPIAFVEIITAAQASTAAFGFMLEGLPLTWSINPAANNRYEIVSFDVHPGTGWGSTTITNVQDPILGSGLLPQVTEIEWFALGFEGLQSRYNIPLPTGRRDAVDPEYYTIYIEYDIPSVSAITGDVSAKQGLYIFVTNEATQLTTLRAITNPWMASTPKAFPAIV